MQSVITPKIAFFAVLLILMFATLYAIVRGWWLQNRGVRVTGRIVGYVAGTDGEGRTSYRTVASFMVQNQSYQVKDSRIYGWSSRKGANGEYVEISYVEGNPTRACIVYPGIHLFGRAIFIISATLFGAWWLFLR